jgi:DnaK suppressor protein
MRVYPGIPLGTPRALCGGNAPAETGREAIMSVERTRANGKLDSRAVEEIRRFLAERRAKLQTAVRTQVSERRSTEAGRAADTTVWATESLHDEIHFTLMDRQSRQVAQIDAALERLARGEYGHCHDCEEFIGLPRLRAMPFAQRCSRCQSAHEARLRRGGITARERLAIPLEAA